MSGLNTTKMWVMNLVEQILKRFKPIAEVVWEVGKGLRFGFLNLNNQRLRRYVVSWSKFISKDFDSSPSIKK